MPKIEIIKSPLDISHLGNNWKKVNNFSDKNIYTDKGRLASASYKGRRYQIIAKYERQYTALERIMRVAQGIWMIIRSFGSQWNSKKVNHLFYKNHESKRFAILTDKTNDAEIVIKKEAKHISSLGSDAHNHILSFLDADGLAKSNLVSKSWNKVANNEKLWNTSLPQVEIFGEKEWKQLGIVLKQTLDIGVVPPLPSYLNKILQRKCPFFPGKKVGETHRLVFIPETINNQEFNLDYLLRIAYTGCLLGVSHGYSQDPFNSNYEASFKDYKKISEKSHWILMTHQNIPDSSQHLKRVVNEHSLNKKKHYESIATLLSSNNYGIPNPLEAATSFILKRAELKNSWANPGTKHVINDNSLTRFEIQNNLGNFSSEYIFVSLMVDFGLILDLTDSQVDCGISPVLRI